MDLQCKLPRCKVLHAVVDGDEVTRCKVSRTWLKMVGRAACDGSFSGALKGRAEQIEGYCFGAFTHSLCNRSSLVSSRYKSAAFSLNAAPAPREVARKLGRGGRIMTARPFRSTSCRRPKFPSHTELVVALRSTDERLSVLVNCWDGRMSARERYMLLSIHHGLQRLLLRIDQVRLGPRLG
jgi:hypothetical protein